MGPNRLARVVAPTATTLGYALFLATNAAGVWGGVFPFLPMEFQTERVTLWFSVAQTAVFCLAFAGAALLAYLRRRPARMSPVWMAAAPYAVGWALLVAAVYLPAAAAPLAAGAGALLGAGSAAFYVMWQCVFASEDADSCNRDIILGTAWASVLYFALYLIPRAVTAFLIPLVFMPLFCLAIVIKGRELDLRQPMFEDVPREHPVPYARAVRGLLHGAVGVGSIGFCGGITRALAIDDPSVGPLVNALSMAAALVAASALLLAWQRHSLRLSATAVYGAFFPAVVVALAALPMTGATYDRWLAAGLYALFNITIMLMMIQCAQISRDRGIDPLFSYGVYGFVVYGLHGLGFLGGLAVEGAVGATGALGARAGVSVAALAVLGLVHFLGMGGLREALTHDIDGDIELMALRPSPAPDGGARRGREGHGARGTRVARGGLAEGRWPGEGRASDAAAAWDAGARPVPEEAAPGAQGTGGAWGGRPGEGVSAVGAKTTRQYKDRLSKQVEAARAACRLTEREADVTELIVRGYTVRAIAEMLAVSENTVRSYSKRIYAKLDIHKKSELIDIISSMGMPD